MLSLPGITHKMNEYSSGADRESRPLAALLPGDDDLSWLNRLKQDIFPAITRSMPVGNNGFGAGNTFVTGLAPGLRRTAEMVVCVRIVLFAGRLISEPLGRRG